MSAAASSGAVTLRPAVVGDHGPVTRLVEAAGLPLDGIPPGLEGFVVAEADGRIVGAAGLEVHGGHGLLRSVAVDPSRRGGGLGAALVERVEDDARARGLEALWLLTTDAAPWFTARGFRELPRDRAPEALEASVEFRGVCPASATLMHRPLDRSGGS